MGENSLKEAFQKETEIHSIPGARSSPGTPGKNGGLLQDLRSGYVTRKRTGARP